MDARGTRTSKSLFPVQRPGGFLFLLFCILHPLHDSARTPQSGDPIVWCLWSGLCLATEGSFNGRQAMFPEFSPEISKQPGNNLASDAPFDLRVQFANPEVF